MVIFVFVPRAFPTALEYPFGMTTYGPGINPSLPLANITDFFRKLKTIERASDIARDPNDVPPPITRKEPARVKLDLVTKDIISEIAPGVFVDYWTFNGTVPGPMVRVREGDTIDLTITNDLTSVAPHNIDFHAVTGPGGGAVVTNIAPGETKKASFKTLNPGLYIYHCAHANVANHMAHGMYGLILVEPKEGLPKVDKEFYVVQGEFYPSGSLGTKGLQIMDAKKLIDGQPEYIVFNGRVKGTVGNMKAEVGDTARIYVGNGGVNLISSFHVIGEIFDTVYPEGAIGKDSAIFKNVQTTIVPAGGAAIVDMKFDVPGNYILVDHALARLDRGAWGIIEVTGNDNKEIYDGVFPTPADTAKMGH
ncbi:MAG TPA: nitrite reductase, copper-containing [Candidatus Yonathbacteria bacterium]|nr:nitrite reductase, copper-containing [Candidatus Yonathbacteria bacterium]